MTTNYKVLGQVLSTAATATVIDNLFEDPTLEWNGTSTTWYAYGNDSVRGYNRIGNGESTYSYGSVPTATSTPATQWILVSPSTSSATFGALAITTAGGSGKSGSYTLGLQGSGGNSQIYGYALDPVNPNIHSSAVTRIPISGNTTYYFSHGISSSSAGNHSFNSRVYFFDSSNNYITYTQLSNNWNPSSSNVFERRQHAFTTPLNATSIGFWFQNNNASYTFYLDGIALSTNQNLYNTYNDTQTDAVTYPGNVTYTSPFTGRILGYEGTTYRSRLIKSYASALVDLYTVPASTQTICSTITISNGGNTDGTYRIAVLPSGETLGMKHFIAFDHSISSRATTAMTFGITLNAGDKIKVQSDNSNVSFSVFGSEVV